MIAKLLTWRINLGKTKAARALEWQKFWDCLTIRTENNGSESCIN